jgi:hypothetical protein
LAEQGQMNKALVRCPFGLVLALLVLTFPTSANAETGSCPPNFAGFPGASKIRVTNSQCATAMRIVRNIRRNIAEGLPARIGRFRWAYRYVTAGDATWQRARAVPTGES